MEEVFDTWQPDIMRWFIEHGADVEAGGIWRTDRKANTSIFEKISAL